MTLEFVEEIEGIEGGIEEIFFRSLGRMAEISTWMPS